MTYEQYINLFDKLERLVTLITPVIAAYITLQMSRMKKVVDANQTELAANTEQTREATHEARKAAQTAVYATEVITMRAEGVAKQLNIRAEKTDKKLQKIDENTEIAKKLLNGDKTQLLQDKAEFARALADSTPTPENVLVADETEKEWKDHHAQVEAAEHAVKKEESK